MCGASSVFTCYDVRDPERPWREAVLGRYSCLVTATEAGRGAGEGGVDLAPEARECVVLQGRAFSVTLRGDRRARYYEFTGRFCAEEWEDWERGGIDPSITSGGQAYSVDVMDGHYLNTECRCAFRHQSPR